MKKRFKQLDFPEIWVFQPQKFSDNRGLFFENFNFLEFKECSEFDFNIVQENISISKKNVIRGMHFQKGCYSQSKIINVLKGKILDVILDIRPNSSNFGKWISYYLDDKMNESVFIPSGFAHGFQGVEKENIICYKVDNPYNKKSEGTILWNDKDVDINWLNQHPILSVKDSQGLSFKSNFSLNNFEVKNR